MQGSQTFNEGPPKRLYRSRVNRMISGVCGGLGEYLNMDPVVIRIIFILLALFGGGGILLYLIGIFVIPENPNQSPVSATKPKERTSSGHSAFWGWVLIILGALFLIPQFTFIPPIDLWDLPWGTIWAILFIVFGIFLLLKSDTKETAQMPPAGESATESATGTGEGQSGQKAKERGPVKHLFRSRKDRMISGVCGGLAEYFDMDPTVLRLIFVFLTIFSKGLGLLAYIILIFAMPEEKPQIFPNGDQS